MEDYGNASARFNIEDNADPIDLMSVYGQSIQGNDTYHEKRGSRSEGFHSNAIFEGATAPENHQRPLVSAILGGVVGKSEHPSTRHHNMQRHCEEDLHHSDEFSADPTSAFPLAQGSRRGQHHNGGRGSHRLNEPNGQTMEEMLDLTAVYGETTRAERSRKRRVEQQGDEIIEPPQHGLTGLDQEMQTAGSTQQQQTPSGITKSKLGLFQLKDENGNLNGTVLAILGIVAIIVLMFLFSKSRSS